MESRTGLNLHTAQNGVEAPAFCTMVTVLFLGLRRPWPGAKHSLPSFSAEVSNALELEPTSESPLGLNLHVIG